MKKTATDKSSLLLALWIVVFAMTSLFSSAGQCFAQDETTNADVVQDADAAQDTAKTGYLIDVPMPLTSGSAAQIVAQLSRLAESAPTGGRVTVVMRYQTDGGSTTNDRGKETAFEDALKVARAVTKQPNLRIVSYVDTRVIGHSTLAILASDSLVVTSEALIGNATVGESMSDETIAVSYKSIAAQRQLFPAAIVAAMVDPGVELARVSKDDRERAFASGAELQQLRESGKVSSEEGWSGAGEPLELTAKQLRDARIAAGRVTSLEEASDLWDLASINPVDTKQFQGESVGALLEITGSVSSGRVRRWQSNMAATLDNDTNTWVISIDSGGGDIDQSATMAGMFVEPEPPLRSVAGFIQSEARADAALIALACDPLYMAPGAQLGGPGSDVVTEDDLLLYDDLIDQISKSTKRPAELIRGLLNRDLVVYRYTHKKTGRIRYATETSLTDGVADPIGEREQYQRGEKIDLARGLTAAQAAELGLIDGEAVTLADACRGVGLSKTPNTVTDRGIVRFVEKLGRSQALAFLLLFVGFVTLSAEANAPGMSVPGFISLVCFALYFWIKFLAGTAEWLELILFAVGLVCIAIELFVIPGFGVFGVGGLAMTIMGLVLMSQTFVIPKNTYQIGVLTQGLWIALGGAFGLIGGFIAMRLLFPHVPLFKHLVMEAPDAALVNEAEKLIDYAHLTGQTGTTTTPLMPSGKARFGEDIIAVVSDGTAINKGAAIRVVEVHGNRVVVEAAS